MEPAAGWFFWDIDFTEQIFRGVAILPERQINLVISVGYFR